MIKYSLLYFLLVFTAGFVLGTLRVLVIEPKLGARDAELLELPLMLLVITFSASWVVAKARQVGKTRQFFYIGMLALVYLLAVEFSLVLGLRGISLERYIASRDPVSGSAYLLSLMVYMLMPWFISKIRR